MALSVTVFAKTVFGNKRVVFGEVAFDASYPTGGESVTPEDLSDNTFTDWTLDFSVFFPTDGYTFELDTTNSKVKGFTTAHTEVANTTDLSSRCAHVPYLLVG